MTGDVRVPVRAKSRSQELAPVRAWSSYDYLQQCMTLPLPSSFPTTRTMRILWGLGVALLTWILPYFSKTKKHETGTYWATMDCRASSYCSLCWPRTHSSDRYPLMVLMARSSSNSWEIKHKGLFYFPACVVYNWKSLHMFWQCIFVLLVCA